LLVFSISVHTGRSTPFTLRASLLLCANKASGEKFRNEFQADAIPVRAKRFSLERALELSEGDWRNFDLSRGLPGHRSRLHLVSMYHGFDEYAT
jgi:hypothetical protein